MTTNKDPVLERARELGLEVPVVQALHRRTLRAISAGGKLEMNGWHGEGGAPGYFCGTTHCRAGWATHLAGKAGRKLEDSCAEIRAVDELLNAGAVYSDYVGLAAELIIRASCPDIDFGADDGPDFFTSDDEAIAEIRRCAELEPPIDDKETP